MFDQELNLKLYNLVLNYKTLDSKDSLTEEEDREYKRLEREIWSLLLSNV